MVLTKRVDWAFAAACGAVILSLPLVGGCSHSTELAPPASANAGIPAANAPAAQQAQQQMMQGRAADAAVNAAARKAAGK